MSVSLCNDVWVEWRGASREQKKKSFFVPFCPRFVFSFLSFVLFVHLTSCFVVLLFSKSPKWREKSQKDWDSHCDFSFVHLLQENASGDESEDYVFLLFNCAWPEEDVLPWEPGCMHALGAREGGLLALTGLSKQDKKRVCFLTSPVCWTSGCAAVTMSPMCCFSTTCLVLCEFWAKCCMHQWMGVSVCFEHVKIATVHVYAMFLNVLCCVVGFTLQLSWWITIVQCSFS